MFTDNFSQGIKQLSNKIGINLKPIHERKSEMKLNITKMQKKRLKKILEPETELLQRAQDLFYE